MVLCQEIPCDILWIYQENQGDQKTLPPSSLPHLHEAHVRVPASCDDVLLLPSGQEVLRMTEEARRDDRVSTGGLDGPSGSRFGSWALLRKSMRVNGELGFQSNQKAPYFRASIPCSETIGPLNGQNAPPHMFRVRHLLSVLCCAPPSAPPCSGRPEEALPSGASQWRRGGAGPDRVQMMNFLE